MDGAAVFAVISSSKKLLVSGLKLAMWDGWSDLDRVDRIDRLHWIAKLMGLGEDVVVSLGKVVTSVGTFSKIEPTLGAQIWAVYVACFGEALAATWAGNRAAAGLERRKLKWFQPTWAKDRQEQAEAAFKWALDLLQSRREDSVLPRPAPLSSMGSPLNTAVYEALWTAFVSVGEEASEQAILALGSRNAVQNFERAFKIAWRDAMSRRGNTVLRAALEDSEPRGERLQTVLIEAMAGWRHQHVFLGVDTSGLPDMPLGHTYVEPDASVNIGSAASVEPVLSMIRKLLRTHRVLIVSADFGYGKSLTARTLAWQWAAEYLDSIQPSKDRIWPVYISCPDDFLTNEGFDLRAIVRRALRRQAEAIGLSLALDDEAIELPRPEQMTVFLLDGFDEVALTDKQTEHFIAEVSRYTSPRRQFVVFSRPQALPREPSGADRTIPRITLEGFSSAQAEEWLWGWPRKTTLSLRGLEQDELRQMASVPILLFMLALTWDHLQAQRNGWLLRSEIYRMFFGILAEGKWRSIRGGHPQVKRAADEVFQILVQKKRLGNDAQPANALLWLMNRVAWEARRRDFCGEPLARLAVDNVLNDELGCSEQTRDQIRNGLLLGMQAQLDGAAQRFFFGHRSFMDFAAASYWEGLLRIISDSGERQRRGLEMRMEGALLFDPQTQLFSFLREMLRRWSRKEREKLLDWAQQTYSDSTIRMSERDREPTFRDDARIVVRHSALALGCALAEEIDRRSFDCGDGSVLLEMSTWWLTAKQSTAFLFAPGMRVQRGALLKGLCCPYSLLERAELNGVDLSGANLFRAQMRGIKLDDAILCRAELSGADLSESHVRDTDVRVKSELRRADLRGAILYDADLRGADLSHANLRGADLRRAVLQGANLENADLQDTLMDNVDLKDANLNRAILPRSARR